MRTAAGGIRSMAGDLSRDDRISESDLSYHQKVFTARV